MLQKFMLAFENVWVGLEYFMLRSKIFGLILKESSLKSLV